MKIVQLLLIIICFMSVSVISAQKSKKQMDLEKNRVQIFNDEERANVQYHFYEKTVALGLSDEAEAEYYRIVLNNVFAMSRLNDKDKYYSDDEQKSKIKELVKKMNAEVKPILSESQYKQHVENFNDVLRSAYRVKNWEWNLD